jgi:hypothetical protein
MELTKNLVEITLLLCKLKENCAEKSDSEPVLNKIEETLASETKRKEALTKKLDSLKGSDERL